MAAKLIYSPRLYLGESIDCKQLHKLKQTLENKPILADVYILTPAHNAHDELDLFSSRVLLQPHYRNREILVVGIARSEEEGLALIEQITKDCLNDRGDVRLREYLTW